MTDEWRPEATDWHGWTVSGNGTWTYYMREAGSLPSQGWKAHISSTPGDARTVLNRVANHCRSRGWTFKHLASPTVLMRANDKDAARASSGKFITIYPPVEAVSERMAEELHALLADCRGPRILSDVAWRGSVVHFRYGAFSLLETWDGHPALHGPSGALEPDRREPVFTPPSWLVLPDWIAREHRRNESQSHVALSELTLEGAVAFSNSGGIYRGLHQRHGAVVLKEGREHVSEHNGADAAARIEHEYEVLEFLRPTGLAPTPLQIFRGGGSAFLLMEAINGTPYNRAVLSRSPITRTAPSDDALRSFGEQVAAVMSALQHEVELLHRAGVVHGDLNPRNVLVLPDGGVRLVDFESAEIAGRPAPPTMGTPGFAAPAGVKGAERDLFGLACLYLGSLVPLTSLIPLDREKLRDIARVAGRWFPDAPIDELRLRIEQFLPGSPRRPASRKVFRTAEATHDVADHGVPPHGRRADPGSLFSGSLAQLRSGLQTPGLVEQLRGAAESIERLDLERGLAGIGTAALCAGQHDDLAEVEEVAAQRCVDMVDAGLPLTRLRPGLLNGPSGIALFLALRGLRRGDSIALDRARRLVEIDLVRLREDGEGGLQLAHGGRLVPFLASGSAGIGVVLVQLIRTTGATEWSGLLRAIARSVSPTFTAHAGLFDGRAGLIHFLVDLAELGTVIEVDEIQGHLKRHASALRLHRLRGLEGSSYPDRLLQASDLSFEHGSAGVRSAIAAIAELRAGRARDSAIPSFLRHRAPR